MYLTQPSNGSSLNTIYLKTTVLFIFVLLGTIASPAQNYDRIERGRAKDMLNAVKNEIKSGYYDTNYHGMDIDAKFKAAGEKLEKATSIGQAFGIIAQAVLELNDSHTTFYPPSRAARFEYGWRMQMIGDKCLVTAVKPKSDAETKGLKIGDEILAVEGFRPNRREMWKINYYYNQLSPRTNLTLQVKSPNDTQPREININSKVTQLKAFVTFDDLLREIDLQSAEQIEHRFVKVGNTVVWKMPTFATEPDVIDTIMQSRIKQSFNFILDLRGNGGGYVVSLERLAGYFVEEDTKIADLKGRKEMKPQMAKSRGKDTYKGNLIVLIDSRSASASEIFARFVQLRKRGVVIGDRSMGAVMQSRGIPMQLGVNTIVPYGMSLTNADVIMEDGVSLEHVGVVPQLEMLVSGVDLAAGRDPILAAALKLFNENVSDEQAGKMFPFDWEDN